jgi:hypothetical protein
MDPYICICREYHELPIFSGPVTSRRPEIPPAPIRCARSTGKARSPNHQGGLKDVLSQYTDNEYRHADYSTWASNWLVETTPQVASQFNRYNWGRANTTPAVIGDQLCSV